MGPALLGRPDDRLSDEAINKCRTRMGGLLRFRLRAKGGFAGLLPA